MKEILARRPSPATAIALLALVVALGGTAIALPGRHVIDRNDLRRNVVRSANIKNGQVQSPDLAACPRATRLIDGLCWDRSPRGAAPTVLNAGVTCGKAGGRLPTAGQLIAVDDQLDLGSVQDQSDHYADALHGTGPDSFGIVAVGNGPDFEEIDGADSRPFRCVYERVR